MIGVVPELARGCSRYTTRRNSKRSACAATCGFEFLENSKYDGKRIPKHLDIPRGTTQYSLPSISVAPRFQGVQIPKWPRLPGTSRSRTNHVHGERCINIEQLRHSSIQPHGNLHAKCLHIVRGYVFSKSSVNRWIRVKFGYCIVPLPPCCCCCRDIRLTGDSKGDTCIRRTPRLNNY
ncbi:uncharacterized protein LOC122535753 isoform X1 [Frieseomelitta varia]|uniref:uncharacterized protein LOC122535753 isoform X1 n=1 Tax=Frieseomelitta varia TaxID=561572 RepID=UPI001CB6969B|nr:uncharacterized protein LOC122535753 isoform X1 [Frieseomelitta varia]